MAIDFNIKDLIDILLVAFIMYQTYMLIRGTTAVNIFIGIIFFVVAWFVVSNVLKMQLLGAILDKVMSVGAIALIVIFKDEIRRFFSLLGSQRQIKVLKWFYSKANAKDEELMNLTDGEIDCIVNACAEMSKTKCGALIVIKRTADLNNYTKTGECVNADISSRLIRNIFFKNSPLHDGAMIVESHRINTAAAILPVSKRLDIPAKFGLRHRAAIGLTEKTDANVIVVSEETGGISFFSLNSFGTDITPKQLSRLLKDNNS